MGFSGWSYELITMALGGRDGALRFVASSQHRG